MTIWVSASRIGLVAALVMFAPTRSTRAELIFAESTRGDGKTLVQFTSGSGAWNVPIGVSAVELLVVGGGGAGSYTTQGGGGGGGVYSSGSFAVSPGASIVVSVGAGGVINLDNPWAGSDGGDSIFGTITSYGGKAGIDGNGGDSGGTNQGGTVYLGGEALGAGAGAGQDGGDFWFTVAAGGNGLQSDITGTPTYYGGGGSAMYNGAAGGLGGGGSTTDNTPPGDPNGVNGLGGGGAGGRFGPSDAGFGGLGIVMVAYSAAAPVPEPSSIALAVWGASCAIALVRRRRATSC